MDLIHSGASSECTSSGHLSGVWHHHHHRGSSSSHACCTPGALSSSLSSHPTKTACSSLGRVRSASARWAPVLAQWPACCHLCPGLVMYVAWLLQVLAERLLMKDVELGTATLSLDQVSSAATAALHVPRPRRRAVDRGQQQQQPPASGLLRFYCSVRHPAVVPAFSCCTFGLLASSLLQLCWQSTCPLLPVPLIWLGCAEWCAVCCAAWHGVLCFCRFCCMAMMIRFCPLCTQAASRVPCRSAWSSGHQQSQHT